MKIIDLIDSEQILYSDIDLNTEIARLAHDPKECTADSLLVLPNSKKPMAEINEAPTAVLCGKDAILQDGIKAVRVKSPRSAISDAYFRFYKTDFSKTKLIGITGTNGKTSTATFIKHAFLSEGVRVGFIGTGLISVCNRTISEEFYSMTTPDPWLLYPTLKRMVEEGCEIIVMEVSSHSLELDKVAPLKFDIGVFTNLSMEHLDFHGDIEKYFEAKSKLFSLCDKAVINIDDYYGRRLACDLETEKVTVGVLWRGDAYVTNIQNRGFDGIEYIYHGRGYSFTMKLKAAGIYNIYNSMLAIAVCTELGLKPCRVKMALSTLPAISGRYEIIKDDVTVIIDYAHTDVAMENILKNLYEVKDRSQGITVIFGCGGERDKTKRARMARVAEIYADNIVITSDNSRREPVDAIISDIISGFTNDNYKVIKDRRSAITEAIIEAEKNEIIAIIGKGAEKYNIDSEGYHKFDEREIIYKALKQRSGGS